MNPVTSSQNPFKRFWKRMRGKHLHAHIIMTTIILSYAITHTWGFFGVFYIGMLFLPIAITKISYWWKAHNDHSVWDIKTLEFKTTFYSWWNDMWYLCAGAVANTKTVIIMLQTWNTLTPHLDPPLLLILTSSNSRLDMIIYVHWAWQVCFGHDRVKDP